MAARAKGRRRASEAPARAPLRSAGSGLWRLGKSLAGWCSTIELPERVKREVLALACLSSGLLFLLALLGFGTRMALVGALAGVLEQALGRAAILAALILFWLAIEIVLDGEVSQRRRRLVGLALFFVAIDGYLGLIGDDRAGGGALGSGIARVATGAAGELGAGIVMFTLGLLGVYLITAVDLVGLVRASLARRSDQREIATATTEVASERPQRAARARVEKTDELPVEPAPRPLINLPKRDEPAKAETDGKRSRARADRELDETPAEPFPASAPLPELARLGVYDGGVPEPGELEEKAALIQETLGNFRIDATVREIFPGPAVTLFALEPGPGVKVRRITELQNDLALALAARSIRIEAPVPGMARVGIEIPNSTIHTVGLRETVESGEFQASKAKLAVGLGRDVNGTYVVADLTRMPHLLIAGSTGSGKSVCINGIIATFLLTHRPEELQMVLIDPKMVELTGFNGVPHLRCPVVTEMNKVVGTLRLVLKEMEDRYQRFSALGVRNIDGYNLRRAEDHSLEQLPYLVVIIDELADLMMTTPDEVETLLVRLAQMARATGIHLLIATQRPSVDVLTGLIKANVPARIAFAVTSQTDSRVILDLPGAERLLGKGDMLFLPPDAAKPVRIQGSFIDDKDLQYIVRHWRKLVPNHAYDEEWTNVGADDEEAGESGEDPLMEQAIRIVRQHGTASASMLQRRLRIGYNRAARLIEQMEDAGLVGPADGSRGRPVLIADDDE